jgi:peptidoglycan/LPS O-acetylase OafA/YrhL
MDSDGDGRRRPTTWQRRITRGLELLGLSIAVLAVFGLLAVGVEADAPVVGALGLILGVVLFATLTRR